MQIYIRRGNEEFGPYSREAALEYLRQGIFKALDDACYAGMTEWKPVGELLGISDSKPGRGPARRTATQITEFNPSWTRTSVHRQPRGSGRHSPFMIFLNGALILIVATVAFIRWGNGSHVARHYLAAISGEFAKLANGSTDNNGAPTPATAAPVTAKPPLAAEAPSPTAAAASTPAPEATPTLVAASTPALAAEPAAASTPALEAAATPAATAAMTPAPEAASAPALAAATPAPPVSASTPEAAASPAPALAASPAPALAAASTPASPAAASAPAQPKPFDPADLAGNPSAWPKTLKLKQAAVFPVLINSQVVGSVTVPPGTLVTLVSMQGDQLTLQYQGETQTLSWQQTDIEEQVAKTAIPAPATPSATRAQPAPFPPGTAGTANDTPAGN
jgi:hypothetical protein